MNNVRVSVIIPAYNEAKTIRDVVQEILACPAADQIAEVLVIDDGSTDGTGEDLEDLPKVRVVRQPYNKGNGAAIKTGLRMAQGDAIVVIDGDGQHPPADVPRLLEQLDRYDLVVGARGEESQTTAFRDVGNLLLRRFASFLIEREIPDLTSGFRAFKRTLALEFIHLYPNGFSFPSTITLAFIASGYSVGFLPYHSLRRKPGTKSKIHPFSDGARFLMLITRLVTLFNPMRVFLPVSVFMALIGLAITIRNLLVFEEFSVGGVLFLIVGINVFFFGLVVDQLATLRLAVGRHEDR
jgi:glycosyltransferase involved in cell wall biosynthesis